MSKKVKKITLLLSVIILLIIGIITGLHVFNKKDDGIRINLVNLNSKNSDSTFIEIKGNKTIEVKDTSSKDEIIFVGPSTTDVPLVTKKFDLQGYDIEIPDSITLQLKDGDKVVAELELNEENNWTQSLSPIIDVASANPDKDYDLVEYSENEEDLKYYVGDYEFIQTEDKTPVLVLQNTITPVLALQKVWDDNNNIAYKRPETVTLELFQGDTLIHSCEVSANTSWLCETNITDYDPTLTYTLKENFESELYTSEVTSTPTDETGRYYYYEITNTFSVPDTKIEIPVEKVWEDGDNFAKERPSSVEIAIVRNKVVYQTKEFTSAMDWKYTFTDLPKYDEYGNEYVYEVIELDEIEDYTSIVDGYTITNNYEPDEHKVSFNVTKNWDDNKNYAQKRPEEIQIELYGSHNENDIDNGVLLKTITLTSENALEDNKNIWQTTIEEFTTTYDYFYLKEENSSEFYKIETSTLTETVQISSETPETTGKIKVDKIEDVKSGTTCDAWSWIQTLLEIKWIDEENIHLKRPTSIDIEFYVSGSYETEEGEYEDISGNTKLRIFENDFIVLESEVLHYFDEIPENLIYVNNWTVDFTIIANMYGYVSNIDIEKINYYTLPETLPPPVFVSSQSECSETTTVEYTYQEETTVYNASITNTFVVPDVKIDIPVEKVWEDSNNFAKERPSSVEVALVRNNVVYQTKEFTSAIDWKYTFTDLPKYDEFGKDYVYEVIELDKVEDYTSTIDGYTITNKYEPDERKVSFNVTKNWDDNNNYTEKRPEEIQIEIYGAHNENDIDNGVLLKTITLTSENVLEDNKNIWATTTEEFTTTYDYFYIKEENTSIFYKVATPEITELETISGTYNKTTTKIENVENADSRMANYCWVESFYISTYWDDTNNINIPENKNFDITIYHSETNDESTKELFAKLRKQKDKTIVLENPNNNIIFERIAEDDTELKWKVNYYTNYEIGTHYFWINVEELDYYSTEITETYVESGMDCGKYFDVTYTNVLKSTSYNASITNTFVVPDTKIEFPVEKVWVDNNDEAGERPSSVDIAVVRNGKVYQTKNVTSAMNWKYTFTELPKYDENGDEYYYEVIELDRLDNYETTIDNGIITNTYKKVPTKVSFDIVKNWNDNSNALGKRPSSVEVEIYGTNTENATTGGELLDTITLNESNATEDTNIWKTTTTAIETSYKYFYVVENNASDFYKTTSTVIEASMIVNPVNDTTGISGVIKPTSPEDTEGGMVCLPALVISLSWEDSENENNRPENVDVTVYISDTNDESTKEVYGKFRVYQDRAIVLEDPIGDFPKGQGSIYDEYELEWSFGYASSYGYSTSKYYWLEQNDIKNYSTETEIGQGMAVCEELGSITNTYEEESTKYQVTLTNTFEIPDIKNNVVINKIWSDNNDENGKRPESITVDILNGNTIVETATLTATNGWEYTSKDLPYYDNSANVINYTVLERTVDFYEASAVDVTPTTTGTSIIVPQTYQITNTFYVPENKVNITVNKVWDDNDNAAGKRPDSVTLQLLADGEKVQNIEVTAADNWSTTINDLPKYNAKANEIVYSLDEENVPDFYEKSLTSNYAIWEQIPGQITLNITNIFVVPETTTNVVINKVWDDNNNEFGKRPESITLQIKEGNTVVSEHQVTAEDNWQYTFTVPKYDADANEITYTADEKETNVFYQKSINGTTVTNTFNIPTDTIDVTINKVWNDNNDEFGKRPSSVTLQIKNGNTVVSEQKVTSEDGWKYTFTVPKYDAEANEIVYTADEQEINQFYEKTINGTTVTNSFVIPNTTNNVVINKIWSDNYDEAGKRPESIIVEILRDNTVVETATITEANGWEYTSSDLPYYDNFANVIEYEVREKTMEFYNSNTVDVTPNTTGTSIIVPQSFQITNTFYVPEDKVEVTISKVWDDNNDKAGKRPDSITLQIKNGDTIIGEQTVTSNDNWEYTFEVPKYDEKADRIVYTADEKTVPTFYKKVVSGTTVTNTFYVPADKIDVTINKVWNDNNDEAGKRPESITLQIKDGDNVINEYTVTSSDDWKHTFTVPKYDANADEITYTADELELNKFYQKTINGTTVTNTFGVPTETVDITSTKVWNDNNDKAGKRPESVTLQIKNGSSIVEEIKVTADNNWTAVFTDLPKYNELGNEISYTVDEKETTQFYKKEISGTTVTNTFYVPEDTKEVTATKIWKDNSDKANKRPDSIVLQVKYGDAIIEEKEVTAYDNWSATFAVPKYDENADEISYTVDELETPEFYKKEISGTTITNKFYVPEDTIEIKASKIWDDNDNESGKRLDSITFQLKNGNTVVKEQKVSEENEWTYTFTQLPKYDENADVINYTLDELETSEFYIKTISEYTITNKFVVPGEQKEISGQKIWDDYNNEYNTRPESVTIEVYGNNELVTEYVVSSEDDWKFNIKLDLYDNYGNEIEYTLKEEEIEGYDCTIDGYTITNKLETRKIKTEVIGEGGTISGDEDIPYGSDSTIDNIIIKPSNGYVLGELRINGELIDIDNKSDEQILEIIKNVREDQLIQVTFVKEPVNDVVDSNPNTSAGKPLIIIIIVSLINILGFKHIKRKRFAN